jgi:uncharacterized protein YcbK (DUF882 family)
VRVGAAQTAGFGLRPLRALPYVAVASCLVVGASGLQRAKAVGDTRTISLHHMHTDENLTITFKKNGKYDEGALKKLNWVLRDWRKNEATTMDPEEIDLLWEVYQEVGATEPIEIVCGYRSPETNTMLRRRSKGVARFSQHTLGKAIDFYIPGVPLDKLRATAMKLQGGGVGYYPTSGSPFVHLDVGNVRAWPRMTREQLVKLFPDGRTAHIPADGTPLPGYQLALADLEHRHGHAAAQPPKRKSLIAALFGVDKNAEEADDAAQASETPAPTQGGATASKTPVPSRVRIVSADNTPVVQPQPTAVPLPPRRPMFQIAGAASKPAPTPKAAAPMTVAALSTNDIIRSRGLWDSQTAAAAPAAETNGLDVSSVRRRLAATMSVARRDITGAIGPFDRAAADRIALAFADTDDAQFAAAAKPGHGAVVTANAVVTAKGQATLANKPIDTAVSRPAVERLGDPWMRGLMLAVSLQDSLVVTRIGDPDYTGLTAFMQKPVLAVVMSFSSDPLSGLSTEQFSGSAVVFPPTVTFANRQRTAKLD